MTKTINEIQMPSNFGKTITGVITFYRSFNDCFNKVYDCFDKIDKNGGKDEAAEQTKAIINYLSGFHSTCYGNDLIKDFGDNSDFEKIKAEIISRSIKTPEIIDKLRKIQTVISDALTHDLNWEGQQCCVDIISEVLNIVSNLDDIDNVLLQELVRTISELVFDCALAICALQPLTGWNFGTKDYSLLTPERQLVLLLNKAIVVDRMSLSLHSLGDIILRVNKLVDSFFVLNWKVYYAIGFLNYKIHKYEDAKRYFEKVCTQQNIRGKKEWFHSHLLIAYSYEYSGQFIKAIEQLALSPEEINSLLGEYSCQNIDNAVERILGNIINVSIDINTNSLISLNYTKESCQDNKITFSSEEDESRRQIEVLHALAHCLNEYSIRKETRKGEQNSQENINFPKFTFLARAIMKFIAERDCEYWTCYATIHGEYADYHQAIEYLDDPSKPITQETLLAERKFFRYYFKQMLGEEDESDREDFKAYCAKYSDNDAQCHIKIFEFRTELRKFFSKFFDKLSGFLYADLERHKIIPENIQIEMPDKLRELYEELCALNPTLYMNVNVRVELRKMQRAYRCLEALIEYIQDNNYFKHSVLVNACNRFCRTRSEFQIESNELKIEPTNIQDVFFAEKGSISYCLHNSDSIFLLAPISGVVVYQYQTGTIDTLFGIDDIGEGEFQCEIVWNELLNTYTADFVLSERPIIKGINWSAMPSEVTSVFCWRGTEPNNIIVAQKDGGCYIRKIVDSVSFGNSIKYLIQEGKCNNSCVNRDVNFGNDCLVSSIKGIKWLEIVHCDSTDGNKTMKIVHQSLNAVLQCFIILGDENTDCHKFHRGVKNAYWSYEDNSVNADNITEQSDKTGMILLGKKYLSEILKNLQVAVNIAEADTPPVPMTVNKYNALLERYKKYNEKNLSFQDAQEIVRNCSTVKNDFEKDFPSTQWRE